MACLVKSHESEGDSIDVDADITKYHATNLAEVCEVSSEIKEISKI